MIKYVVLGQGRDIYQDQISRKIVLALQVQAFLVNDFITDAINAGDLVETTEQEYDDYIASAPAPFVEPINSVEVFQASNQSVRLALTGLQVGDEVSQDDGTFWKLKQLPSTTAGNWFELGISGGSLQISQVGDVYPAPTASQLLGSITFIGNEFPVSKRQQDIWIEIPTHVVQTAITDITGTGFRVNWNAPIYADSVVATLFEGYQVDISTDNFITNTTIFTTFRTYLFTSLATVAYNTRVRHVQRFNSTRNLKESINSNAQFINLALAP